MRSMQIQCSFSFRMEKSSYERASPWALVKKDAASYCTPTNVSKGSSFGLKNRLHLLDMPCRATVVRIGELLDTFGERSLFSVTALELKVCHPISSARSPLPLSLLCLKALGQYFTPFFPC